ncbi:MULTISPECIES: Bug family tripartite tricarboxylate transporter substrate binding protein [Noviherbaspirillum]|uniref:Bug family tripartite tricarboxylate transporter substrate binding protein n=1 Tax=Noviherbaspirillum TaxID=1344552 RepID=UPI00178C74A3|nr:MULTISPECIES: tripartite tricarboxylate transporter substrate binding protein [Noviherbaspirillum]
MQTFAVTALGVTVLAVPAAQAQSAYPSKPITMVIPFPPGGPTDLVARVLAQKMGEQMGQQIIVDNRGGANGNIGSALVAKAPADGYTVLYNTSSIVLSPALYKSLSYDVQRDLAPVALTATVPLALVVNPSLPVNTMKEFIDYAKANPGKLSYGSAGSGNITHLGAFQFLQANGIEAVHVPYKGSAPADADLVGGQIQFMTDTINSVASFVRDKRMRLLAVTTPKRIAIFPDVPTVAESGMPGFEVSAWQGLMVPAKTPEPIIKRLNSELMKALQSPDVQKKLGAQGAIAIGSTPDEYSAYLKAELARWSKIVKQTGVSLD